MRDVQDNLELAKLQAEQRGFILNARNDVKRLHLAGCEAVGAMVSTAYPKTFFGELNEAREYLDGRYGKFGWLPCGLCRPG
jgi:hypothetical protein